jgi:hypothetical protein
MSALNGCPFALPFQGGNSNVVMLIYPESVMPGTVTISKLEREIEKLPPQDQLKLVERLAHHLRKTGLNIKKELDLTKLYGLGKGLWSGEDAQAYVDRLYNRGVLSEIVEGEVALSLDNALRQDILSGRRKRKVTTQVGRKRTQRTQRKSSKSCI